MDCNKIFKLKRVVRSLLKNIHILYTKSTKLIIKLNAFAYQSLIPSLKKHKNKFKGNQLLWNQQTMLMVITRINTFQN